MAGYVPNVRPAFEVEKLEGTYFVTTAQYTPKTDVDGKPILRKSGMPVYERSFKKEERPRGFMVYFPQGHSTHIPTEELLIDLGYAARPKKVDIVLGEEVPEGMDESLKELSIRKTRANGGGRRRRDDGIENPLE